VTQRPEDVRMSLGDHVEELRRRLLRAIYAFVVIFMATFFLHDDVRAFALKPLDDGVRKAVAKHQTAKAASGPVYERAAPGLFVGTGGVMSGMVLLAKPDPFIDPRPTVLSPQEGVFQDVKLSMIVASLFAAPFLLYQLWAFVRTGLYESERRAIGPYLPLAIGLFVAGAAFGYLIMLPAVLEALEGWLDPTRFQIQNRLQEYLSLFYTFTFALGLLFNVPVVMMMLAAIGIVTAKGFLKAWRWAILGGLVAGAVLNPAPDVLTQLLFAGPIAGLYFLGVALAAFVERGQRRRAVTA
jgi:sec-independent protein translocase protein TatC